MSYDLITIIDKIILGIGLAAPIGPVNAEMIKRGLASGFWGSFNVRLGGALANFILLFLAYFGLESIMKYPKLIFTISNVGVIILIYLGIKSILTSVSKQKLNLSLNKNLNKDNDLEQNSNDNKIHSRYHRYSIKNGLLVGFGLSFASPIGLMFWLSTFATSMQQGKSPKVFNINDLIINMFIIVGVLIWGFFISIVLHYFSKIIDEKKLKIITAISGLILIYFGIKYGKNNLLKFYNASLHY